MDAWKFYRYNIIKENGFCGTEKNWKENRVMVAIFSGRSHSKPLLRLFVAWPDVYFNSIPEFTFNAILFYGLFSPFFVGLLAVPWRRKMIMFYLPLKPFLSFCVPEHTRNSSECFFNLPFRIFLNPNYLDAERLRKRPIKIGTVDVCVLVCLIEIFSLKFLSTINSLDRRRSGRGRQTFARHRCEITRRAFIIKFYLYVFDY